MASASPNLIAPPAPGSRPLASVIEGAVLAALVVAAAATYWTLAVASERSTPLTSPLIVLLLLANLLPAVALLVLIGRRVAISRAQQTQLGGKARLHVRLVALFSVMAAVPMLLVASAASLLFQYGVEFSSSERARGMVENAAAMVRENYQGEINRVVSETGTMSGDLAGFLTEMPIDGPLFTRALIVQTYRRNLSEALIVKRGERDPLVVLNPSGRTLSNIITAAMMDRIDRGEPAILIRTSDRIGVVVPLAYNGSSYLYASRIFDDAMLTQLSRGKAIIADYRSLQARNRTLQLRFNAALLALSLLIVGIAVWIAFRVADRVIAPVAGLVDAARRVEGGDLSARVVEPRSEDEIGTLSRAFNQMTGRLEAQTSALESRRALIEAVMSGVSAGVVSIGRDGRVRLINRSAETLLRTGEESPVGRPLLDVAPELGSLVSGDADEAIVQIEADEGERTLAVRIARDDDGAVLTFDDITEQLSDQRRAAWSDVARRIAHEIKNPLTPIQLAAERLQRRYGSKIENDDGTFARLTETIVRQVGDLRRMVDEFSSFARMPKPVFRPEQLVDIARQALFLHEVAHPGIAFAFDHPEPGPTFVCDRRQIGQALTNIVKNAVEAVEARGEGEPGRVTMAVREDAGAVIVTTADNGIGLPPQRDRIAEPYVTTRARGTGLGLAIVSKIVEEHGGTIAFDDRPGGGTIVTMTFAAAASQLAPADDHSHMLEERT